MTFLPVDCRKNIANLITNFISAHDAQWTGYEHIAFQTVAGTVAAKSDMDVPIVYCVLFASWVCRGISLSVSCLTVSRPETEAKDVIQKNTDK